jgi:hypothetical protein
LREGPPGPSYPEGVGIARQVVPDLRGGEGRAARPVLTGGAIVAGGPRGIGRDRAIDGAEGADGINVPGRSWGIEIEPGKDAEWAEGVAMGHRRLFALVAVGLVLAASGCAGPARRAGMVGSGGEAAFPRLIRPADPIARLSPAPLTVGPVASRRDPGSYTRARPGSGGAGIGAGTLSVGGGQLADRGPASAGPNRAGARVASRAEPADRGGTEPGSRPSPSPSPALAAGAWPEVADPEEVAGPDPAADPAPRLLDRGDELASTGPPSPSGDEAPSGPPPMLAAGIDLETYATPPVSSDPDARLASGRRPIAVLRNALSAIRPEPTAEEPQAESPPASRAVPVPEPIGPSDAAEVPGLDPLPEPPGAGVPGLDPLPEPPGEPTPPARDDVRPASARPGPGGAERPATYVDPHLAIEAPSPFGPDRPRSRILSRVRDLGHRLIPGRDASGEDGPGMLDRPRWSLPRLGPAGGAGPSIPRRGGGGGGGGGGDGRWWTPEVGHPSNGAGM